MSCLHTDSILPAELTSLATFSLCLIRAKTKPSYHLGYTKDDHSTQLHISEILSISKGTQH